MHCTHPKIVEVIFMVIFKWYAQLSFSFHIMKFIKAAFSFSKKYMVFFVWSVFGVSYYYIYECGLSGFFFSILAHIALFKKKFFTSPINIIIRTGRRNSGSVVTTVVNLL